jgi:hypothetical protein
MVDGLRLEDAVDVALAAGRLLEDRSRREPGEREPLERVRAAAHARADDLLGRAA